MITPVILCGGSGSRLWPLSREHYPKPLLPLTDETGMVDFGYTELFPIDPNRVRKTFVVVNEGAGDLTLDVSGNMNFGNTIDGGQALAEVVAHRHRHLAALLVAHPPELRRLEARMGDGELEEPARFQYAMGLRQAISLLTFSHLACWLNIESTI